MHFKFLKTQHEKLKDYLEGFYVFQHNECDKTLAYLIFPSNHVTISIYKNVDYNINGNKIVIGQIDNSHLTSLTTFAFSKPIYCQYKGRVKEITFCFTPLGLNHFLENNLKHYSKEGLHSFIPFTDYANEMKALLDETDENQLQQKIEYYWLSKLKEKNLSLLQDCIQKILYGEGDTNLADISVQLNTSRQHINRLFNLHLCKTPAAFRKIARFRKTLQNRIQILKSRNSLTSLTYESFFYDQSHLIKDFHSLTGMNPKTFFGGNKAFENGNINWFFYD